MAATRAGRRQWARLGIVVGLLWPAAARAATDAHGVDLPPLLLGLTLILVGARLGGALFERFALPAVLGELLVGVLLGNLSLIGFGGFETQLHGPTLNALAQIGVLFLLFGVGLETDIASMAKVGWSSLLVAVLGVVAPMVLGYTVTGWFFPDHNSLANWFVGATLCATSVGITARVLADVGRAQTTEGRIILGAAVIDDVLGLIVLAVVVGIIQAADRGASFDPGSVLWIIGKSVGFLGAAILAGRWLSRRTFQLAVRLPGDGVLLTTALALCFASAYFSALVGLAPIVGAFAAGLVLDEVHYRELRDRDPRRRDVHELLKPLATFLVPVFFVLMGMGVDLAVFARGEVLAYAAVLTAAAVAGKQACSFGVLERGADRLAVGLGMIPRGEVGLIFASIGAGLTIGGVRVIDDAIYSAVIIMVTVTTLLTPPLLVWKLGRRAP